MFKETCSIEAQGKPTGLLIALPGRGISAADMAWFASQFGVWRTPIVAIEPINQEWYPQPKGANDQSAAVSGVNKNWPILTNRIDKYRELYGVHQEQTVIVGYSAGAVMGLRLLEVAAQPYAAIVSVAGAIFEPHMTPPAKTVTPVLLRHNMNDECFSWEERYLPMRDALISNGYNLTVEERPDGNHGVKSEDAQLIGRFVRSHLGY